MSFRQPKPQVQILFYFNFIKQGSKLLIPDFMKVNKTKKHLVQDRLKGTKALIYNLVPETTYLKMFMG